MTTILETFGTIRPDGTLDLEQKLLPLAGRVKVRVESAEAESDEEFAKRFARLAATWREDTRLSSKMGRDAEHPAYKEIIAMGERAVPLLLAELERNGGFLFMALQEITGANPVPEKGDSWIKQLNAAWIAWGRSQGYRWENAV